MTTDSSYYTTILPIFDGEDVVILFLAACMAGEDHAPPVWAVVAGALARLDRFADHERLDWMNLVDLVEEVLAIPSLREDGFARLPVMEDGAIRYASSTGTVTRISPGGDPAVRPGGNAWADPVPVEIPVATVTVTGEVAAVWRRIRSVAHARGEAAARIARAQSRDRARVAAAGPRPARDW